MRAPRRIFRGAPSRRLDARGLGRGLLVGCAAVLGTGGLVMLGMSTNLMGRVAPGPERVSAAPGGTAVVDGDTLRLDGRVVRLQGVQAPMRGDVCRGGTDCGGAATMALAGLVRDRRVECVLAGRDSMGRPYAACEANGTDLSGAIVASGWARAQPGAARLADLELRARQQGAGLWAMSAGH